MDSLYFCVVVTVILCVVALRLEVLYIHKDYQLSERLGPKIAFGAILATALYSVWYLLNSTNEYKAVVFTVVGLLLVHAYHVYMATIGEISGDMAP
jgi:hypothetical protein